MVDLESRLDVGGEVVETVLSVLEGESYRYVVGGRGLGGMLEDQGRGFDAASAE